MQAHANGLGRRARSDAAFIVSLGVIGGLYVLLIVAMLAADASFTSPGHLLEALRSREIRYAIWLSLISCTITMILSVWVAVPLGCSRGQAFFMVVLPEARPGLLTAATLAWARSLGEFGPILVFSGATRMRTEVLSTSVFLELSVGRIEAAVAVSLLMVACAVIVLLLVRLIGGSSVMDQSVGRTLTP